MDEQAQRVIPYIKVTNGTLKKFTDRCDGVPCVIPPGGTVQLEYHVAQHFFGLPDADPETGMIPPLDTEEVREDIYRHMTVRHGYNSTKQVEAGEDRAFVDAFKFKPLVARLIVEETEGPEQSTADPLTQIEQQEAPTPAVIPVRSGASAQKANKARIPNQEPGPPLRQATDG